MQKKLVIANGYRNTTTFFEILALDDDDIEYFKRKALKQLAAEKEAIETANLALLAEYDEFLKTTDNES